MSGKGSSRRPQQVDPRTFSANWERVFNTHDKCGTDECCMQCDTAVLPSAVDDAATAIAESFAQKG